MLRSTNERNRRKRANKERILRLAEKLGSKIKRLFDSGKTDGQIATGVGLGREVLRKIRIALKLHRPNYGSAKHIKIPKGFGTVEQYVASRGWPRSLSVRDVMILDALWSGGPMLATSICKSLGLPSRSSVVEHRMPELIRKRLILKTAKVKGSPLYMLAPVAALGRGQIHD